MKPTTTIKILLTIGILGLLFSGYLSYQELFGTCTSGCPVMTPNAGIFGYPACVYGFFMYLAIVIIASLGLWRKK